VIKFFIKTAGYCLLDHKRKGEIWEELKVEPVDERKGRQNKVD